MARNNAKKKNQQSTYPEAATQSRTAEQSGAASYTPAVKDMYLEVRNCIAASGYHRVRVLTIDPFESMIGGITWMVSLFEPKVNGKQWVYQEGNNKPLAQKILEVDQIVEAVHKMKDSVKVTRDDFLKPNPRPVRKFVRWLIDLINEFDGKNYWQKDFENCFKKVYVNEEAAIADLIHNLRNRDRVKPTGPNPMDLFDTSLLRDYFATPWMIITEYVNYLNTGKRIYPKYDPGVMYRFFGLKVKDIPVLIPPTYRIQVPEECVNKRNELQKLSEELRDNLKTQFAKDYAERMISMMSELNVYTVLVRSEGRFIYERMNYFADSQEYSRLLEKSRDFEKISVERVDYDRLRQLIKETVTRVKNLREALKEDMKVMRFVEKKMTDRMDREKSEDQAKKKGELMKRISICSELIPTIEETFQAFCEAREQRDSDEPEPQKIGRDIDGDLAKEYMVAITHLDATYNLLSSLRALNEPNTQILFTAFYAFVMDLRSQYHNMRARAAIMFEQRRDLQEKLVKLRATVRKNECEAYYGKIEAEQVELLSAITSTVKVDFDLWEMESPVFQMSKKSEDATDSSGGMRLVAAFAKVAADRAKDISE
uniref:KOG2701 domain-containing protein n=1 Tax=Caenorhabditis tropicalis TaxID=1561998 RepID=A0A1I7TRC4_9PELO